jgi:hypothetical protein
MKSTMADKNIPSLELSILDNHKDSHPVWDEIAKILCPSPDAIMADREYLAVVLTEGSLSEKVQEDAPYLALFASRLAQKLMGKDWCKEYKYKRNRERLHRIPLIIERITQKIFKKNSKLT